MAFDIIVLRSNELEQKNEGEPIFSMLMILTGSIFTTISVQGGYEFFRVERSMELNYLLKICL